MSTKTPKLRERVLTHVLYEVDKRDVIIKSGSFHDLQDDIFALRQSVYVNADGRLNGCDDMGETFDRYNDWSHFFVSYIENEPVGCLKVIRHGPHGLPCTKFTSVDGHDLKSSCEFGHLMVKEGYRSHGMGMALMKAALDYSIKQLNISYIFGDFFVDRNDTGRLHEFYKKIGFIEMSEPYQDERFVGAPLSIVGLLPVSQGFKNYEARSGAFAPTLEFFFGDYYEQ